jgi:hypothetical protein
MKQLLENNVKRLPKENAKRALKENVKRALKVTSFLLSLVLVFGILAGCSTHEPEAKQALSSFLTAIQGGDHAAAYALIADTDKKIITADMFAAWRSSADALLKKSTFTIKGNPDRFKGYEYKGTRFPDAYGFNVAWDQEPLVASASPTDYDQDEFMIMIVEENGSYKAFLMIEDLGDRTASYQNMK